MRIPEEKNPKRPSSFITNNLRKKQKTPSSMLTFNQSGANVNVQEAMVVSSRTDQLNTALLDFNHVHTNDLVRELAIVAYDMFSKEASSEHLNHCSTVKSTRKGVEV